MDRRLTAQRPGASTGRLQEAIDTYTAAFNAVIARPDFPELAEARLGLYPQMTGDKAKGALKQATQVPAEAKAFVKNWLKERYGVE